MEVEVNVRAKNFKLKEDIEGHIRRHIERMPRHLGSVQSAEVVLSQQPTRLNPQRMEYRAQLTIQTRTNLIRSEVCNAELLTAVDEAMDHLSRQIERQKSRSNRRKRGAVGLGKSAADMVERGVMMDEAALAAPQGGNGAATYDGAGDANADEDEDEGGNIVRVKSFSVKPMFPEDAIEQMELLGHNFFVFWDAGDDRMSVLYKRNDGNYGLIQPELG